MWSSVTSAYAREISVTISRHSCRDVARYHRDMGIRHREQLRGEMRVGREVYNPIRPHESLGDLPPVSRFRPSPRPRPARLPEVEYPEGSELRRVRGGGHVLLRGCAVRVGSGLIDEWVRFEDRGHELGIYYGWKEVRCLPAAGMVAGRCL